MNGIFTKADLWAIPLFLLVWWGFFSRALPLHDQALRPANGDFYGQFYTFSVYQYDRLTAGELPLWNPYNHAGFPFIADPQSAVFYPPRLFAIAVAHHTGGWSVDALLLEGLLHFLIASFGWYGFLRLLTHGRDNARLAAFTGSLIATYGGFLTGYPLLQLAILEGAVWLPFVLAGLTLALRSHTPSLGWLAAAAGALALSWLAGHSQTSWFCTVLATAYLLYGCWQRQIPLRHTTLSLLAFGGITFAATAVTLLPGLEYLRVTSRTGMSFDEKARGFPLVDVVQFIVPGVVSLYSPLFISVLGLALALWGLRDRAAWFWGIVALGALLLSFGGNAPFYGLLYPLPTGMSFFRGQERFAFLVNAGLAAMAAYGVTLAFEARHRLPWRRYLRVWLIVMSLSYLALLVSVVTGALTRDALPSALLSTVALFSVWVLSRRSRPFAAVVALPVFVGLELWRLAISSPAVFVPPQQVHDLRPAAPLTALVRQDDGVFRVDGFRGLHDNFASVEQVQDIRGISPLFIASVERIVNWHYTHNPFAWELFAVKYVYSDQTAFSMPTRVIAAGVDRDGPILLHQLTDPRPFAHLIYRADVVDSDEFAWALLNDPRYRPRETIILDGPPSLPLPDQAPSTAQVTITGFHPEALQLTINTPTNAILSLAMVDYPGWQATLNGAPTAVRRAYGALMALEIPAGQHTLALTYRPSSVIIGAIISVATWLLLLAWAIVSRLRVKG